MIRIAIDGPGGAGKSSVAKEIAKELGIIYVDTGALYRTIGLFMLGKGISPKDTAAVVGALGDFTLELKFLDGRQVILLDGKDVGDTIRTPEVSMAASAVSAIKEVREYLIGIYAKAVGEWGLDGLKLDFIDSFVLKGKSLEYDERRDYQSLEDAIDVLMTDVTNTLRAINPEVLIEFRQSYVGPAIRKYGNMLRVADCPNDAICNRQDIVTLRLTSGNTAVHSDMLMWNKDDTVESAALQFVSVIYSVPQISVKLAGLRDDHKKMLEFYLSFWRENRDTLMNGKILAANPESAHSLVCAEKDGKAIFTAYTDTLIDCRAYSEIVALNSTRYSSLIIKGAADKSYRVLNCMGEVLEEGKIGAALCEINVPTAGMICIK